MIGTAVEPSAVIAPRTGDQDSRARTHLANERTFLAWLRTGLSLVAVGLAVAGFVPIDLVPGVRYVTLFAALLVVFGTVMTLYGANRYVAAHRQIEAGSYRPATGPIVAFAVAVGILGLMSIPVVLLLR